MPQAAMPYYDDDAAYDLLAEEYCLSPANLMGQLSCHYHMPQYYTHDAGFTSAEAVVERNCRYRELALN